MARVVFVDRDEKDSMRDIFQDYMVELSQFDPDIKFDGNGKVVYKWFDYYWEESSRYPMYYMVDGVVAGIAMVRQLEPYMYEMAEFYVKPEYRVDGNAKAFAMDVMNMFDGNFDISTRYTNPRAVKFWHKVASMYTATYDDTDTVWARWIVENKK